MKLLGIDHIQLVVKDVAKSTEYYRKLGLALEGTLEGGKVVFLWNGDEKSPVRLELHQALPGGKLGLEHIAFRVECVEGSHQELNAVGLKFEHEPRYQPLSGRTIATFQDLDGIGLQLARKTGRGEYEDFR